MTHEPIEPAGASSAARSDTAPEPPPAIALVPEPTTMETLLAANAEFRRMLEENDAELSRRAQRIAAVEETRDGLRAKLVELERNPFLFQVVNHDAGSLLADLGEQYTALCRDVLRLGAKGKLSLTLAVKPHSGLALNIEPVVKVAAPPQEPIKQIFFLNPDGTLTRDDPRQGKLL